MTFKTADGKEVIEDGERFVVNLLMMDSQQRAIAGSVAFDAAGHRPGYVHLTDADARRRAEMYANYQRSLSDRWREPPAQNSNAPANTATVEDAYRAYDETTSGRWRGDGARS
jgi:hypothetical protein